MSGHRCKITTQKYNIIKNMNGQITFGIRSGKFVKVSRYGKTD